MDFIQQRFQVNFEYKVIFTEGIFDLANSTFSDLLVADHRPKQIKKLFFVIDEGVVEQFPQLTQQIDAYFKSLDIVELVAEKLVLPGGEIAKNSPGYVDDIIDGVNRHGIDRHSYIVAIGGGSILDLAGYAAAIAHRGIKIIRIPTTVLSQNDSAVGVKNGVNYRGKKNFLGTFVPPFAVINDYDFLGTLSDRDWRAGISEAVKVALIKDRVFFEWLEIHADELVARDKTAMQYLIRRCAQLHLEHIGGADPFEKGSSRPLDFGHWSAHKLEQLSNFEVIHGEAVAIGIALDSIYSSLIGLISSADANRIVQLLLRMKLPVSHQLMQLDRPDHPIFRGLHEFQEHLGGELTIMLLQEIGKGKEVHSLDTEKLMEASNSLCYVN